MLNSFKRQQVHNERKHVGNKSKQKVKKKKSNTSRTNILLKCQTRAVLPVEKIFHFLDTLPLLECYKIKHLLDFANSPDWIQDMEPVSLNAINIKPMSFAGSSDVLPWNHNNDDPAIDGPQVDIQTVQVLRIDTTNFTSNELSAIDSLP